MAKLAEAREGRKGTRSAGERTRFTTHTPERFFSHVVRQADGCWIWNGPGKMWNGYATQRYLSDAKRPVHRIAYEIVKGPIPEGMSICHSCDVRLCVNPDHLFAGTPGENTRDMVAKGRHKYAAAAARGEAEPSRKLSFDDAEAIRAAYEAGELQRSIAARYGVSPQAISCVITRATWGRRYRPGNPQGLSAEAVVEIRRRASAGESQSALAREYGVTSTSIHSAVKRRSWKHVPESAPPPVVRPAPRLSETGQALLFVA